jgi:hypothetical protein
MLATVPILAWVVIGLLVLIVLAFGSRSGRSGRTGSPAPPITDEAGARNMDALPLPAQTIQAKPLLSAWERAAIDTLARQLPATHRFCPQVRLLDMLTVQDADRSRRRTTRNRLGSKSVDFAVIDPSGRVVLVVELNDSSHDRPDRRDRYGLVQAALDQAGIPLAVFRPQESLDLGPWLNAV